MTTKEEAKAAAPGIGFDGVLPIIKAAGKVTRAVWKVDEKYILLNNGRIADEHGRIWLPRPEDLLAEDWEEVA